MPADQSLFSWRIRCTLAESMTDSAMNGVRAQLADPSKSDDDMSPIPRDILRAARQVYIMARREEKTQREESQDRGHQLKLRIARAKSRGYPLKEPVS